MTTFSVPPNGGLLSLGVWAVSLWTPFERRRCRSGSRDSLLALLLGLKEAPSHARRGVVVP